MKALRTHAVSPGGERAVHDVCHRAVRSVDTRLGTRRRHGIRSPCEDGGERGGASEDHQHETDRPRLVTVRSVPRGEKEKTPSQKAAPMASTESPKTNQRIRS